MKLIATLGATKASHKHTYEIDGVFYEALFSFEALKLHYRIDSKDIYILGTTKTQEILGNHIASYNFIKIDDSSIEDIFRETLEIVGENDIVDLTQSFRSISLGVFLALGFSKSLRKSAKDLLYAQTLNPACNPSTSVCRFRFVSLKIYDEIADMARTVNTFVETFLLLDDLPIAHRPFIEYRRHMRDISTAIFTNHFAKASELAQKFLNVLQNQPLDIDFLQHHISRLQEELQAILSCNKSDYESERLAAWSGYLLSKDILLHAVTVLYEAMVAFLDEEVSIKHCNEYKNKHGKIQKSDTYTRRNCLKKELFKNQIKTIPDSETFREHLKTIDKLRNISAHAFTSNTTKKDMAKTIEETVKFLESYFPQRYSKKEGAAKPDAFFSER